MKKFIVYLIILLFSAGCSRVIVCQVNGKPVIDNIVSAKLLTYNMVINYMMTEDQIKKEGEEYYHEKRYLSFNEENVVKSSSHIEIDIYIFNPSKKVYRAILCDNNYSMLLYEGQLSRNDFKISLPNIKGTNTYIFVLIDEENKIFYRSFPLKYNSK